MRLKRSGFLLLDNMLGFFLILQALALIPLCIIPTQKKITNYANRNFNRSKCTSAKFVTGADYVYPNKVYRLSIYNNMLRLTGESSGHMPIFVNQGYIVLKRHQSTLKIIIDSIQREWEYYLDFKAPPRSIHHNSHRTVIKS